MPVIKCKCGVFTNSGKNCSKCQDLDITVSTEIEWDIDELELDPSKIDDEVLEFIENFNKKYKKGNKE